MLKPLIRIIKTCVACCFVCISIAIILEFNEFQHSHIIQEFSIGAACSFIVAIISTFAQYKVEYKNHYSEYISAASNLIFAVVLASNDEIVLTDKKVEHIYTVIEEAFQRFSKAESEVLHITKKGTEKQFEQNKEINKLYVRFLKEQFNSHKSAVLAVSDKESIIRAIDVYLKCWPECYEKNHLAKLKEIIVEDRDKDQNE